MSGIKDKSYLDAFDNYFEKVVIAELTTTNAYECKIERHEKKS